MSANLKEFTKWKWHFWDVFPAILCSGLCQGKLQSFLHIKCPAPLGKENTQKQKQAAVSQLNSFTRVSENAGEEVKGHTKNYSKM